MARYQLSLSSNLKRNREYQYRENSVFQFESMGIRDVLFLDRMLLTFQCNLSIRRIYCGEAPRNNKFGDI